MQTSAAAEVCTYGRGHFCGCSLPNNGQSKTVQMSFCYLNLPLGELGFRIVRPLAADALFQKLDLF